jgi:hypothetical protein
MILFLASGFGFVMMLVLTLLFIGVGFALGGFGLADDKPGKFAAGAALLVCSGVFSLLAFLSLILNVIAFAKS